MNLEKVRAAAQSRSTFEPSPMPAVIAAATAERIIDLDVRDDLRNGSEPFSKIMRAQASVPADGVLRIRAIFEPVPLYMVLGQQGFSHWTERLADDDWQVWFYRGDGARAGASLPTQVAATPTGPAGADLVIIDVRGLEPPEPMTRTLEALETLPAGKSLLQVNARVPQLLLPLLAERGFEYVLVSDEPNEVRGLIRRTTPTERKS
jgi:hypothetical protein